MTTINTENQHVHDYDPHTKKCRWCERPIYQLNGAWPVGTWFQRRRMLVLTGGATQWQGELK